MWYDIKLYPALRTGTDLNWMKQKGTALMRSMKRAGALTLAALILAFSLTACGKDGGSSGSGASSSAAGSTSSSEPITVDLDAVTDVFLTTAGIPGDTVVAQVGDVDITAAELLYWVAYSADSMLSYYSTYFGITELPWDTEDASGVTLTQGDFGQRAEDCGPVRPDPRDSGGGGRDPVPGLPGHLCRISWPL